VTDNPYFLGPALFDPEVTHAMGIAFEGVCRALFVPYNAKTVRQAIAEKIIDHARGGERDPDRLRDAVLKRIGLPDRKSAGAYVGRPQSPQSGVPVSRGLGMRSN
jgi:hypothetical protein